jgi:DNA-binding response OmpR family regulator
MNSVALKYVFIIEDHPGDQMLIEMAVREVNPAVEVFCFGGEEDFLPLLEEAGGGFAEGGKMSDKTLVLLDLNAHTLSGPRILQSIRHYHSGSDWPVVMLSDFFPAGLSDTCYEFGANDLHTKPASYEGWVMLMSQTLRAIA